MKYFSLLEVINSRPPGFLLHTVLATFLLANATQVYSATPQPIFDGSFKLLGFDNISVDGIDYIVRYVEGSYISIFGTTGNDFSTFNSAITASQALLDATDDLFANNINYDEHPEETFGCTLTISGCFILTPYRNECVNILNKDFGMGLKT